MRKLKLTRDERIWLRQYRKALATQYPGLVRRLLVYGSKARGEAGPDSDLDILLVLGNEGSRWKKEVRWTGHMLAATLDAVPSIMVYTEDEWEHRRQVGSPFYANVERDAVPIS